MWVLIFVTTVGFNTVNVSSGKLDTFETKEACTQKGDWMKSEMANKKVDFKCVEIKFRKES